ncbi:Piso0_000547 [Millerozyma farinosa CBS 7064]|uniref:O-acyltransferase n=1 Tax=Pichia sorbitophila (strain ATCC MYA-4447 / BCRC 22081 / CBS 7064 / NBRC 10061 / NRRL Y-12695) TaxID=559304 RepID=G8YVQ8_PICSO|nr:Piso0_000547 [Millerozyma farinosa CBS 7064]CCE73502.1 Piso0_000547 [Millerozyma farinosa CBS 7064]
MTLGKKSSLKTKVKSTLQKISNANPSSTEEQLLKVTDLSNTRRRSLVLNDDYGEHTNDNPSDEDITKLVEDKYKVDSGSPDEKSKAINEITNEIDVANQETLLETFNKMNQANDTRLIKRKKSRKGSNHTKGTDVPDVPASNKDKSKKYRSRFGDIDFNTVTETIFDSPSLYDSDAFGVYVLFWLGTAFLMVNNLVHFYFESDKILFNSEIVLILRKDLWKIAATDLAMYLCMYFSYYLQYLHSKNVLTWDRSGWLIQSVYDFVFIFFWLYVASDWCMSYTWVGKVFLLLHNLVLVMKMHSYAFYNGYLWRILGELKFSESFLSRLEDGKVGLSDSYDVATTKKILLESISFCKFELEYQSSATSLSSEYDVGTLDFDKNLETLQEAKVIKFPQNISLFNFFEFTMYPTLVYTLNFPRTRRIRWKYVGQKVCGIFGIIFLMILVAQSHMLPIVIRARECRSLPLADKVRNYFLILLDMIPPFLMEYIFTFFLIWELILNAIAELSRLADRDFYGAWWSCTDWSEYARIWNRPVHKFLLRHVYHSTISALKVNKMQAILFTFIFSSLVHELVMFVIFGTLRGYLLLLQMSQLPLIMLSNTPFMRGKKTLGNVICWFGFISGPSMICTLYLMF